MKLRNVKTLYLVKQMIQSILSGIDKDKAVKLINQVLLDEGGAEAVLYPYNSLKQNILELHGQCMKPCDIASKLGIADVNGRPDEDLIEMVVEEE